MKFKKHALIISFILCLSASNFFVFSVNASSETNLSDSESSYNDTQITEEADLGENVHAVLYSNGDLIVSGKGEITKKIYEFENCDLIRNAVIQEGITAVSDYVFKSAVNMNSVSFPKTLKTIGTGAFTCTGLYSVDIPDSVTSLGDNAFALCYKLKRARIGSGVTEIATELFRDCYMMDTLEMPVMNTEYNYDSEGNVSVKSNLGTMFLYSNGKGYETSMLTNRFSLRKVIITGNPEKIPPYLFYEASVSEIVIPESVKAIGEGAFGYTCNIKNFSLPSSLEKIEDYAFIHTEAENIQLPDSLTSIGAHAFELSSLKTVTIPDSVTNLGEYAFSKIPNLESAVIGSGIKEPVKSVFGSCSSLSDVTMPVLRTKMKLSFPLDMISMEPVLSTADMFIDNDEYEVKNIKHITIRDTETIPAFEFDRFYGLRSVTLPDNLIRIESNAFKSCCSLSKINLPDSLRYIDDNAFMDCRKITDIRLPEGLVCIGKRTFSSCGFDNIVIPDSVTGIGENAFEYCNLRSAVLGSGIDKVVPGLFYKNINMHTLTISNLRTSSFTGGFKGHYITKSFLYDMFTDGTDTEKTVTDMKGHDLSTVIIRDGTTELSPGLFAFIPNLHSIELPSSIEHIGADLLYGNTSMQFIYYKGSDWSSISIDESNDVLFSTDIIKENDICDKGSEKNTESGSGDIDGNGISDISDLSYLSLYLIGDYEFNSSQLKNADLTGDGKVRLNDLSTLKMILSRADSNRA